MVVQVDDGIICSAYLRAHVGVLDVVVCDIIYCISRTQTSSMEIIAEEIRSGCTVFSNS